VVGVGVDDEASWLEIVNTLGQLTMQESILDFKLVYWLVVRRGQV
jgi:hypothetical protein